MTIIFYFFLLLSLPPVILLAIMRLPPIYLITQYDPFIRHMADLVNGLLCFGSVYLVLTLYATAFVYSIPRMGNGDIASEQDNLLAGVTNEDMRDAIINEIWLRQLIPGYQIQTCFSGDAFICQHVDTTSKSDALKGNRFYIIGVALMPALFYLSLSWAWRKRPKKSWLG